MTDKGSIPIDESPRHLKKVSRIKHIILQKYLPSWVKILGSWNKRLCYFDCYAGPGVYEFEGNHVDGSPIIAVRSAVGYLSGEKRDDTEIVLTFIEKDDTNRNSLEKELKEFQPYRRGLQVYVFSEDAPQLVQKMLDQVRNLAPSFFLVDPYAHPLTIPILNKILQRSNTEALINFMFYRINMDAGNPKVQHNLDKMFGDAVWRSQPFLSESGIAREEGFLQYFLSKISARYKFFFRIRFDPEDQVSSNRTKYYLIHASNHPKAVLLMKEVMWPLGDEEGIFDFSGKRRGLLFSFSPKEKDLQEVLKEYKGKEISFDGLREETWDLPFIEKQYRNVIKKMKNENLLGITQVTSKTDKGLKGQDLVHFYGKDKEKKL